MRWSSRKLWVCIGAALTATACLAAHLIDQSIWQTVFMGTVGVYIVSQAGVDGAQAIKQAQSG